ncbi:MAG: transposase family protein, partial [Methanobrevibacter sp.]|nr:transposase family protein [Methanobrevibacter sp.]
MNSKNNIHVSHQSIQNWILKTPEHPKPEPMTLSGYYAFDAQWVKTNGKWSFRLLLANTKTELIIRSKTYTEENKKNINKFISKTLINQKKIAITTDLKTEYKPIVEKLGFKHQ